MTDWIRTHPTCDVFDKLVLQSSDAEFHFLTIVLAYRFGTNDAPLATLVPVRLD